MLPVSESIKRAESIQQAACKFTKIFKSQRNLKWRLSYSLLSPLLSAMLVPLAQSTKFQLNHQVQLLCFCLSSCTSTAVFACMFLLLSHHSVCIYSSVCLHVSASLTSLCASTAVFVCMFLLVSYHSAYVHLNVFEVQSIHLLHAFVFFI